MGLVVEGCGGGGGVGWLWRCGVVVEVWGSGGGVG